MNFCHFPALTVTAALWLALPAVAQDAAITGDPAGGERVFRQCKACHTIESGGRNGVGPNLFGIVGKDVATAEGYRYSDALKEFAGVWSPDRLDAFLADPMATVRGTKMTYRGVSDAGDRADVIAYLNTMSDAPLPTSAEPGSTTSAPAEPEFGQLFVADGVEETYYACTACHSEMIVAQQGKTRDGWDKLFDWMVEEQGMKELDPEEREIILDYLAAHYNTDRPNFPRR